MLSRIAVRSAFFAQPGKGKLRRLRASRTRLLTTMSLCGPSPRSHSPGLVRMLWIAILSSLGFGFDFLDAIADLRRGLVFFVIHRAAQLPLQLSDLSFALARLQQPSGNFSFMLQALVHRLEHRLQAFRKNFIALRTSKTPRFLEIGLAESADRAPLSTGALLHLLRCAEPEEQVGQGKTSGIRHPFFF